MMRLRSVMIFFLLFAMYLVVMLLISKFSSNGIVGLGWFFGFCAVVIVWNVLEVVVRKRQAKKRLAFIQQYRFPKIVQQRFLQDHPMSAQELAQVEWGMRHFFMIAATRRGQLAMPSKIVDEYWHHFLLSTRFYQKFCEQAFGQILHHLPQAGTPLQPSQIVQFSGPMRNTYAGARQLASSHPMLMMAGIPLLFALDQQFDIAGGFMYDLDDIMRLEQQIHQAATTSTSSSSNCGGGSCSSASVEGCGDKGGGTDGCGCGSSCGSSCSSSCSSGCGGGGGD